MDSDKSIFRVTKLVHWVLLLPPVMFGGLIFLLIQNGSIEPNNFYQEYIYIPMALMIGSIVGGRFLYTKLMASTTGKTLNSKLQTLMKATIVRNALYEMTGLATCLTAYAAGNSTILLLIVIIAMQFFTSKPSLEKLQNEGVLSGEEVAILK